MFDSRSFCTDKVVARRVAGKRFTALLALVLVLTLVLWRRPRGQRGRIAARVIVTVVLIGATAGAAFALRRPYAEQKAVDEYYGQIIQDRLAML